MIFWHRCYNQTQLFLFRRWSIPNKGTHLLDSPSLIYGFNKSKKWNTLQHAALVLNGKYTISTLQRPIITPYKASRASEGKATKPPLYHLRFSSEIQYYQGRIIKINIPRDREMVYKHQGYFTLSIYSNHTEKTKARRHIFNPNERNYILWLLDVHM